MSRSHVVGGVTLVVFAGLAALRGPIPWQPSADGGQTQDAISQPVAAGSDSH
jgi:hypothetical protein